jgi:TPR repeat protein
MPEAKRASEEDRSESAEEAESLAESALDIDGLKQRGDVAGLLALARAHRSGAAPGGRDMKRCYDAYFAAAELGSEDAEFAVALFCMTGSVVSQDMKEGVTRLRAAAEKGSVPAKVYLGNLYELGIHYKADPEKADVWYRNAARGAGVEGAPDSEDHARALAELGCARHVLALVAGGAVDEHEKARLLQRARGHGYGLRLRDEGTIDRPTFLEALPKGESGTPANAEGEKRTARQPTAARAEKPSPERSPKTAPSRRAIGLAAFGYALLFIAAGVSAGYAATLGARELVARGHELPWLGTRAHLVFPIVLVLVGILPSWLVYRLGTVLKALVMGGAVAGIGWIAWGTGQAALHPQRPVQALTFGLGGFLAGLLVLGLLGGTKKQPPRRHPSG